MERMATFLCPSPNIQINGTTVKNKSRSPFNPNGANIKLMPSSRQMVKIPFNSSGKSTELLMPNSNQIKRPAKNEWKTPDRKSVQLLNGGFTFVIEDNYHHYIDEDGDVFFTPDKKHYLLNGGLTFTIPKCDTTNRDRYVTSRAKHGYHGRDLMKTIDIEDGMVESGE